MKFITYIYIYVLKVKKVKKKFEICDSKTFLYTEDFFKQKSSIIYGVQRIFS